MLADILRKLYSRLYPRNKFPKDNAQYFGTPILSGQDGQNLIGEFIKLEKPCMITRFGHAELKALISYLEIKQYNSSSSIQKQVQYIKGNYTTWTEEVKL